MSTPEPHNGDQADQHSSVKLTLNAKGDVQIDVKAVAGEDPGLLDEARERAVATFNSLRETYPR